MPGAYWGALLFAVHPVNVESVAWISSRKNLVAMLFFLLSLWLYLKGEDQFSVNETAERRGVTDPGQDIPASDGFSTGIHGHLVLAELGGVRALAMLGKGSVAVMPALLLCLLWWKRPLEWRDLRRMLPFFAVGIGLAGLNVWFQTHDTEEIIRNADFIERVLGAGGVVWFYLYKAILPFDLAFIYPNWNIDAKNWAWWIPLCGVVCHGTAFHCGEALAEGEECVCPLLVCLDLSFAWRCCP